MSGIFRRSFRKNPHPASSLVQFSRAYPLPLKRARMRKEGFAMKISKVLIAYDGSKCADAALEDLRRAGLPAKAHVIVMSVIENWLCDEPLGIEHLELLDKRAS